MDLSPITLKIPPFSLNDHRIMCFHCTVSNRQIVTKHIKEFFTEHYLWKRTHVHLCLDLIHNNQKDMPSTLKEKHPYDNVRILYTMHMFFAFVSRMWEIGIVLLVAALTNNSLFIVALSGLMSSSSLFLFAPSLGGWFDEQDRLYAMKIALTVKVISVTTGYLLCAHMLGPSDQDTNAYGLEIYAVPIVCALANLSFAMVTMSVEKDWVVVLSGGDREWLSSTNSMMTQIDLACNAVAPAVTGVLFSFCSYRMVALVLLGLNAATAAGLYLYLRRLYESWPALTRKVPVDNTVAGDDEGVSAEPLETLDLHADGVSSPPSSPAALASLEEGNRVLSKKGDAERGISTSAPSFVRSSVAGTMISYSFLYFTVLSFSPLMLVFLRWSGLPDHWVGAARGISAIAGFLGAFLFPYARSVFGVVVAGQIFIWYQACLVTVAALSILLCKDAVIAVKIMVICVLASRVGLWAFDLSARQIAQEGIAENQRGAINGKWRSLTAFFDLSSYVVAVIFPNPEYFWVLTSVSAVMVLSAAVLFTASTAPWSYCRESGSSYAAVANSDDEEDTRQGGVTMRIPLNAKKKNYGTS